MTLVRREDLQDEQPLGKCLCGKCGRPTRCVCGVGWINKPYEILSHDRGRPLTPVVHNAVQVYCFVCRRPWWCER